jgi:hypothetical protein
MIRQGTDSFIYGKDEYPSWFTLASQTGTVKYIYSDGVLADTLIATVKGFESAKVGDTIMVVGDSMVVIPAATAIAYGVE